METFHEKIQKFLPFLEEIRGKLYWSAIVFATTFIVGFFSTGPVLRLFVSTFYIKGVTIATTSPFQLTDLAVSLGIFFATVITIPILIYQIYSFIFPGLRRKEKRLLLFSIPVFLILFAIGFVFGSLILFFAFQLLAEINESLGIQNIWSISSYVTEIFITSALLGLLFEFPLVVTGLIKLNIMKIETLKNKRRLAWFIVFIIVSILPPTDGLSLIAMAVPLILLYEITIFINRRHKSIVIANEILR